MREGLGHLIEGEGPGCEACTWDDALFQQVECEGQVQSRAGVASAQLQFPEVEVVGVKTNVAIVGSDAEE